ncbi:MAG TPA: type IIL restriction-modification enzyme MmeI, partial [Rhodothermales bacterium]
MTRLNEPFISLSFLRSAWARDYEMFRDSEAETSLLERLENWARRTDLKETSAEQAFVQQFFHDTWGYYGSGQRQPEAGFTSYPKYPVPGGGEAGGTGEADLALGWFGREGVANVPQVLCEFKGIRSRLDAPQNRKGSRRSPVKQCLDYVFNARRGLVGNETIIPSWSIVTDMNEFRLYWFDRAPQQYLHFVIKPDDPLFTLSLLHPSDEGRFERFLFYKLFHFETLLTTAGKSTLEKLLARQWVKEREIENEFYREYRAFRDRLYNVLVTYNQDFHGTRGKLVRLAQRILDRCLFVMYCEDMGEVLAFPHQLLRNFLIHVSLDEYYEPNGPDVWQRLKSLFDAMNTGGTFPPGSRINCFDGGLFEHDPDLDALFIPNHVFCERGQGQNEASLHGAKNTLLYLAAAYNYAAKGDASDSLGLYTLGRIFEQSITELEILEAEAEGRESLNKVNKRKRDGVYYTPERVVEKIVQESLGARLKDLKDQCRWTGDLAPNEKALNLYWDGLQTLTVLDPACGSGAFLITALRLLLDEYHSVLEQRRRFRKGIVAVEDGQLV